MTTLEKLCRANRWRIRTGHKLGDKELSPELCSTEAEGWNGDFIVPFNGELWHVRISDESGWRHLAVINAQRKVMPSWEIMCRLKEAFFSDDEWVCQFYAPKDIDIGKADRCLHLWSPLNEVLPTPPVMLV